MLIIMIDFILVFVSRSEVSEKSEMTLKVDKKTREKEFDVRSNLFKIPLLYRVLILIKRLRFKRHIPKS